MKINQKLRGKNEEDEEEEDEEKQIRKKKKITDQWKTGY